MNNRVFRRIFSILVILFSICCSAYGSTDYNVTVTNETDTQIQLYYEDPDGHYTAKIVYSKIYLEARVEIYSINFSLSEDDLAYIEYFHSYHLQRYFKMYKCEVADRRIFYSGKSFCRGTFHLYFRT